ncbi:MAG: presenilin family intramembrane aspartyl protease [Candidatus Parcubacteria bacterium]|nr:presenilin family intramembrane aspartyl protease [Candidatus Parcubacteria bacterium]
MNLNWRHFLSFSFIFEIICVFLGLFFSLGIALRYRILVPVSEISIQSQYSALQFLLIFLTATVILLLLLKLYKKPWLVRLLFYLAIFQGLWIFVNAYVPWPNCLIILGVLAFYWLYYKNILIHNAIIIMALSAIAVMFGANLTPSAAIIILLILAVYDFWAVYKTKHMVQMFTGMAEQKVYFTIIIPQNIRGLFKKISIVSPSVEFMFLGTGDIALPAIFVVSCLQISLLTAYITALGTIAGFIFLFILFVSQKEKQPMPGLPPIVLGTLLGFLISQIIIRL